MGLTNALRLGETNIIVEDTRVAGHIQLSSLNVVLPDSLWLYIAPLSISSSPMEETQPIPSMVRWHLISGHQYLIQIKAFSQGPDAHEIYITEVISRSYGLKSSMITLANYFAFVCCGCKSFFLHFRCLLVP